MKKEFEYEKLLKVGNNTFISSNVEIRRPHLVSVGSNTAIDSGFYLTTKAVIGNYIHIAPYVTCIGGEKVTLVMEDFTTIAAGSRLICASDQHLGEGLIGPTIPDEFRDNLIFGDIIMKRFSSIGTNSVVMPGITLSEDASELARLHAGLPDGVLLVVDQAYGEYLTAEEDDGGMALAAAHDNVFVTRTFSKIYGLAGDRIGWGTGSPAIINVMNRIRGPFNVGLTGQAAALAAVRDEDFVRASREHNLAERTRFEGAIANLGNYGIRAVPSKANFVLVLFEGALSAERALNAIGEAGYAVRHLPGQGLPDALRITIGTASQMDDIVTVIAREAEAAS